ncbi:TlpA family protein disulfide reductase [Hippea jasoniae]|uniref:TlpA family protein disulfide reductase n=1 Tax=Hippea jasoniae TaxID=944479 RepID=UPI0005552E6F|nr:TlpA disulfide reductase family protein [Hippea jasoniae]
MKKIFIVFAAVFLFSALAEAYSIDIRLDSVYFDNSTTTNLSNYIGKKPTLVMFFYPDCDPCQKEAYVIDRVYSYFRDKVQIVGISLSRDRYDIGDFIKEHHVKYPVWRIHSRSDLKSIGGILATPTVVIINKQGKIVAKFIGKRSFSCLKQILTNLVEGVR